MRDFAPGRIYTKKVAKKFTELPPNEKLISDLEFVWKNASVDEIESMI